MPMCPRSKRCNQDKVSVLQRAYLTASSSSWGLLVAATTVTCSPPLATPSNSTRNWVFSLREASCSPADRSDRMLSISSAPCKLSG